MRYILRRSTHRCIFAWSCAATAAPVRFLCCLHPEYVQTLRHKLFTKRTKKAEKNNNHAWKSLIRNSRPVLSQLNSASGSSRASTTALLTNPESRRTSSRHVNTVPVAATAAAAAALPALPAETVLLAALLPPPPLPLMLPPPMRCWSTPAAATVLLLLPEPLESVSR